MEKLIGRVREKKILEVLLHSNEAEFLAIYGRRRVGKTFLIREFCKPRGLFFEATGQKDGNLKEQLTNFLNRLNETFHPNLPIKCPETWKEALGILTTLVEAHKKKEKIILFLDELPWLAGKRSGLLQALDYYWNNKWSQIPQVTLIVCGSAASWMLDNLVHSCGGLYNRLTQIIQLKPFTLKETRDFLRNRHIKLNDFQILELYMVFGGIPYYLRYIEKGKSATQNINSLCFRSESLFFNEFELLFRSLFEHSETHINLIREIAKRPNGINREELLKVTELKSGGSFNQRLHELEAACFIEHFSPYGKAKKGYYVKVIDEYTIFYLHWIEKAKQNRSMGANKNYWIAASKGPGFMAWAGYAFEAVCSKHINKILKALELENIATNIGSWRHVPMHKSSSAGAQIDLLIDRTDNAITLCEIKYSSSKFVINKDYARKLIRKLQVFEDNTGTRKQLFLAIISANGLKPNIWSKDLVNAVVTLKDLF